MTLFDNQQRLGKVFLERALSKLGIASRTQTREWIEAGRISVDKRIIKDPRYLLVPETADICLDGVKLKPSQGIILMLHKPKGYVTTKSDEKSRKTIYDLLPKEYHHLHAVGRLDMATTGLLMLTTDTQLSNYLTDPVNGILRTYVVVVRGLITEESALQLIQGIKDDGEILKAKQVTLRKVSQRESHVTIELTEGKNREIRRMMLALGHEVISLKRIQYGKLNIGELQLGAWRLVQQKEII